MSEARVAKLRLAAALALLAGAIPAVAQNPTAKGEPAIPPFRRIYLPADEIKNRAWTDGYLPIEAKEFQRLLETVHSSETGAPGGETAQLERAELAARLTDADLLVGTLDVQVQRRSADPGLLMFDPCSVALGAAQWRDAPVRPAVIGGAADGRPRVLVEGSQLHCAWSLRGERTAAGAVSFRLEFPRASVARVALEMPPGLDLSADQGIVSKGSATAEARTWLVELGGHNRVNLRVVPEGSARERRPLTLLRQSLTYEFSSRGVSVAAQLNLDIHGEPLQRIGVDLDPSLRLVAARYGETDIAWSAAADVESRLSHVVLQLPEPIIGTGRVLRLSALAPLTTGKHWRLPALRPEGVAWQEGTAALVIPNTLVLEQLMTEGCRQSRVTALPAPAAGESIEIQYYRSGGTIEILLSEPRERLKVDRGTLVEVGAEQITSRSSLQLSLNRGQRRVVQADVRPGWTIDAVEHRGAGGPVDWETEDLDAKNTHLKITLDNPISAASAARLLVRGHRSRPPGPAFDGEQLSMLAFPDDLSGTSLISVRATEGYELRLSGAEDLGRSETVDLTPAESQLFAQPPQGPLFVDDATLSQASIAVARRKPSYAVDVRIDAAVQKETLTETYTFQCAPEAARVERLLVHFSVAREIPLEWSLAGATAGQFAARKLTPAEQAGSGLPVGGEAWELSLHLARPGAFELRAIRSVPFRMETSLALASVADAATQRGTLTIRALGDSGVAIKNRRLVSVPAELLEVDRYQTVRAAYHYQPSRDELGSEPAVSVVPTPSAQAETGAWVWHERLDSRYTADGGSLHSARCQIQTAGRQQIHVKLPAAAVLHGAWLDAQRLTLAETAPDEDGWSIDLPSGRSFATLSLYFAIPDDLSTLVSSRQPPFPALDIPMVDRQWSLWLPPGYEVADASQYLGASIAPPTWSQRLFGVLGRGAEWRTFNPLAARDWRRLAAGDSDIQTARRVCQQFAHNLGAIVEEQSGGEELTWGELLTACAQTEATARRAVVVDGASLRALGLTPQSRVATGESSSDRGAAVLKQSDLAIVAAPGAILITGPVAAASHPGQLAQLDDAAVMFALAPGPFADELQIAQRIAGQTAFLTIEAWRTTPESPPSPWITEEPGGLGAGTAHGWNHYAFENSEQAVPQVRVVHVASMRSSAWAIFLGVVAVGWWAARRPAALVLVVAIAAGASLVLPTAYLPLANSVSLGGLFCLLLQVIQVPRPMRRPEEPSRGSHKVRSSFVRSSATMVFVALGLHAAGALYGSQPSAPQTAAEKSAAPTESSSAAAQAAAAVPTAEDVKKSEVKDGAQGIGKIFQVFVPNTAPSPSGDEKYYVPNELYNQLSRQAASADDAPKAWLITRATYQGALAREPVSRQLGLATLKASFNLAVFQADVPIRVPFPREGAAGPVVAARLDGQAVPVAWSASSDELLLDPLAVGAYRLELTLRPPMQTDLASAGFDLAIPPLAGAQLELALPQDSPPIELPTARGQVRLNKERGLLLAELGACNRLTARWPAGFGTEGAAASLEVEELIWVKVRPGTTVVDARFKYRLAAGRIGRIRLLADPRLRLLPSASADSAIAAVHTVPGDPQKIDIELNRSVADQVAIELSFLLTGNSGVGNLRLPRLESSGARPTKRWLAVSVDPAMQSQQEGDDAKPVDVGEFTAAWGATDARPQAAYSIPRGEPAWQLATQPNDPQTAVEQTLAVSVGRGSTLVNYDAIVTIARGYLFQLNLQAPPGLTIDKVSVLEDDVQRVTRWSSDESGRITVFLTAPAKGRQRLTLDGRIDAANADTLAVPQVELFDAEIKKNQLQLYRQPAALVAMPNTPGIVEIPATDVEQRHDFGALVGCYSIEDPQVAIVVGLSPNVVRSQAVTVTRLEREADRWMAEVECHFNVLEGLADTLQFEIPAQWSEPFRLEPAVEVKIVNVPGEQRRRMIVFPAKPIGGKYSLKIRGRVALFAGDRLTAPDVVPLRVDQLERFVVLPQFLDLQQVAWDTLGLVRAELPADFAMPGGSGASLTVYQAAAQRFQASLKAVERAGAAARVSLADIHLIWQPDGNCQGVVDYDLVPGGASSVVLELPTEGRLLHATIDSLPVQSSPLSAGRWRLSLGPQQLPQRLEVVYSGPFATSGGARRFWCPQLIDVEIGETSWTVFSAPELGLPRSPNSGSATTAAQQQVHRLKSLASLMQLPADVVGEHLPEEISRWYRAWHRRYAAARAALALELAGKRSDTGRSEEAVEARELDQQIMALDAQIGLMRPETTASRVDLATQLLSTMGARLAPAHYLVRGESHEFEMRYPQAPVDALAGRWLAAMVILAAGIAGAFALRRRPLPKFAPWWVIGGVGVAWWLLLAPSVIGLVALAAAFWVAARARWQPALGARSW